MFLKLLDSYIVGLNYQSIIFSLLILMTLGVVGHYSKRYLRFEIGERRFWMLFCFFSVGMLISCFANNLTTFYIGWEIVGITSFFLIAFYQTNSRSIDNSLIALANYKLCDIFFVFAIHAQKSNLYTMAGLFLIISTLGKSAQFPFSSWLYRSLEGPTPSSTLFYGGLALHLGPYLLIRFANVWNHSPSLCWLLVFIGSMSAIYGFLVGSARSDLKTSFAFASISQVGLIYIEIGLGYYNFALWHIIGHNFLRTWNYLRSLNFFSDFFSENYHKKSLSISSYFFKKLPKSFYVHCLNALYMDSVFFYTRRIILLSFVAFSFFLILTPYGAIYHQAGFYLINLSLVSSVILFLRQDKLNHIQYFSILTLSQILFLLSIHVFYQDSIEFEYLLFSILSLVILFFGIWPALKIWFKHKESVTASYHLGLSKTYNLRHLSFLVGALCITGSPGTLQFFLQEELFDKIWSRSHFFLALNLVCLTLNTVHIFRIGQNAFLGSELDEPSAQENFLA